MFGEGYNQFPMHARCTFTLIFKNKEYPRFNPLSEVGISGHIYTYGVGV